MLTLLMDSARKKSAIDAQEVAGDKASRVRRQERWHNVNACLRESHRQSQADARGSSDYERSS
jgi:hypothetical protein